MPVSELLKDAYQRNKDRPVAYVDESLRGPQESGKHFYILTAVVVAAEEREPLRTGIEEIVGGNFWHTSDELLTASGFSRAKKLLKYLGQGEETAAISVNTKIESSDTELEDARAHCMSVLLPALERGSSRREPTSLVILERRRDRRQQNRDSKTHRDLVTDKSISRHLRLIQASPADEHLLWLPDLVSSAVRRKLVSNSDDLLSIIVSQIEWPK